MRHTLALLGTMLVLFLAVAAWPDAPDAAARGHAAPAATSPDEGSGRECSSAFYWDQPECPLPALVALDDIQPVTGVDSIPPIDEPRFESLAAAAGWLTPDSPVLVVSVDGETRAYPLAIMTWHEVANDEIAGSPVVVTYCPLCNSGLVFDRAVDGEILTFGTSGHLFRSNLVMYDRQHRNFWLQFNGRAVAGERFAGAELERIPSQLLGFRELADLAPDAAVLSRVTGHDRPYGTNPYRGYDRRDGRPFLYDGPVDERLPQMERVVGVGRDDPVAVPLRVLRRARTVPVTVGGEKIVLLWAPGQASALDEREVDAGRDVGQTGAFRPVGPSGEPLTLQRGDVGSFVDQETGSRWNLRGKAVSGPLAGHRLEQVAHDNTFWFTWFAFHTDTRLVTATVSTRTAAEDARGRSLAKPF